MTDVFAIYGTSTLPPSVMDRIPPALHADIVSGVSTVDVSSYINAALADYKIVRLPLVGQVSIGSPLSVPSGGGILGVSYGCTVKALPNFGDNPMVQNASISPANNAQRDKNLILSGFRIDGNKANNSTGTEFSHGVKLYAVDGCKFDLQIIDPKGDGITILNSYGDPLRGIGCANITGKIRTHGCRRQGVAIICGEQIDLDVYDTAGQLMSVDLEPDHPDNFIRNIFIRLLSIGTGDGSDVSGGVCVAGDGLGCLPTNVTVDMEIHNSGGYAAIWRDAKGLVLRGSVNGAKGGLIGIQGGSTHSDVQFQGVRLRGCQAGMAARETAGSHYNGSIEMVGCTSVSVQIENAGGGVLGVQVRNGSQQGLYLNDCDNMTFPNAIVENCGQTNVWLRGGSTGNRFPGLKSANSTNGWGFLEDSGCDNNKALYARVTGNSAGNVSLSGSGSLVQAEP